jgi:hypothetical protein
MRAGYAHIAYPCGHHEYRPSGEVLDLTCRECPREDGNA